jgi:predicted RND superfamily exporter protein
MKKWLGKLAVGGLCLMATAMIGFFTWLAIDVDCDGFACMGFLMIIGPVFFFGLILMFIAAIVAIGTYVYSLLKRADDE